MRQLTTDFAARLASGATTLCHCWRILRRDGTTLGFTDHDCDLVFGGTTFLAHAGFEASAAESQLGFAVGGSEVAGALVSDTLSEADFLAGRYDGATVESWLVDWSTPDSRLLLDMASIGEIRRSDVAFTAELRALTSLLDQEAGRLFQTTCTADLGDKQCRASLDSSVYTATRPVLAAEGLLGITLDLRDFADGWFTAGVATFTLGANAGASFPIKEHRADPAGHVISFWTPLPFVPSPGDSLRVSAGCDKGLSTCRDKFANVLNFRGCPFMPGNDIVTAYASTAVVMDGRSLFR